VDTTPNLGLPYPESSDAPDGPAQIGALALAIDTAVQAGLTARAKGIKARVQLATTSDVGSTETIVARTNFTAEADRCYKVSVVTPVIDSQGTSAAQTAYVTLRYVAGVGPVTNAGTIIGKAVVNCPPTSSSTTAGSAAETVTLLGHINDVAAGTYDVGVGLAAVTGTPSFVRFLQAGTTGPDFQPWLLIEDVGPAL
jgi:hypothetical protein